MKKFLSPLIAFTLLAAPAHAQFKVSPRTSVFNVTDTKFGAIPNDSTDDRTAVQAAINTAIAAGGGIIYFPEGTFDLNTATPIDPDTGGITFAGEGHDSTIIKVNEGSSGTPRYAFKNIDNEPKGGLVFRDIQIRGTLDDTEQRAGNPFWLDHYSDVTFERVKFKNIGGEAMDIHYVRGKFTVRDSIFEDIGADGVRARDVDNITVVNNTFLRLGDHSIALHTADTTLDTWLPQREGIVITGNHITNAGSIAVLGAKKLVISNNVLKLIQIGGMHIRTGVLEGNNPSYDISITNNIITDIVDRADNMVAATGGYIYVEALTTTGGADTNNTKPTEYDSTSGTIIKAWDWNQADGTDSDHAVPPLSGVIISGNILERTLPAVAEFDDWGYGEAIWQGVYYNPEMTEAIMRPASAHIVFGDTNIQNVIVSNNILKHSIRGFTLPAPMDDKSYVNWKISNNLLYDVTNYGLTIGSAAYSADIDISGNSINCDPYRVYTNSNLDGTYDADGLPRAFDLGSVSGISIRNNSIRNCGQVISTNDSTKIDIAGNVLYHGQPTALGFNASNKGIGTIPSSFNGRYRSVIIDADPTSATYGNVTNAMLEVSSAMPSTGWYPRGWITWNSSFSASDSLIGWQRAVSGTAHTLGTDWIPLVSGAMASGAAGTPGLYFSQDTDTGLFLPATNSLSIAVGGTERARFSSSVQLGVPSISATRIVNVVDNNAVTNAVTYVAKFLHSTTGTPATGIGAGIELEAETSASNIEVGATIEAVTTDAGAGSEDFDLVFKAMAGGAAAGEVARFSGTGDIVFPSTVTAGGTTGNQTINKATGCVNFAASASALTVTNSLVSSSSIVLAEVATNDATATIKNVVPGSGSFVITLNAAATAETKVCFLALN